MTTLPARAPAAGRTAPQAVAALSLLATAAMAAGYPLIPALGWLAILLTVTVVAAASGAIATRRAPEAPGFARHLAVEPLAMAVMVAYGLFHTHGSAGLAEGGGAAMAHVDHLGWFRFAVALAVAALAVACPVLAALHARRAGLRAGALPLLAAFAMAIMAAGMLLPR
jgi:hypothetical protein